MDAERPRPPTLARALAEEGTEIWDPMADGTEHSLVDLVNRVLDRGVVITGEITLSVAGVDLVYLGLNAVLTSVATAREHLQRQMERGEAGG